MIELKLIVETVEPFVTMIWPEFSARKIIDDRIDLAAGKIASVSFPFAAPVTVESFAWTSARR